MATKSWRMGMHDPDSGSRHASWLELFFDLVFVVTIARLTHYVAHHNTLIDLGIAALLFYPIYTLWSGQLVYSNRYKMDDAFGTGLTLLLMLAALVYASAIGDGLEGDMRLVIGAYLTGRIVWWSHWIRASGFRLLAKDLRGKVVDLLGYTDLALWTWSAFLDQPMQQYVWLLAIVLQMIQTAIIFGDTALRHTKADNSHLPERFGLFVIIALGESVAALGIGLAEQQWTGWSVAAAAGGFILIASL